MKLSAAALALGGCLVILISVGPESWPIVTGWLAAATVVAVVWERIPPQGRLVLALVLAGLCVLLTWEGGLFFLPSAALLIAAAIVGTRDGRPRDDQPASA